MPLNTAMVTDVRLNTLEEDMERARTYVERVAIARHSIGAARDYFTQVYRSAPTAPDASIVMDLETAYRLFDEQVMQPALRTFGHAADEYYRLKLQQQSGD